MPAIFNALETDNNGQKLVLEVAVCVLRAVTLMATDIGRLANLELTSCPSNISVRTSSALLPWTVSLLHFGFSRIVAYHILIITGTEGLTRGAPATDTGNPIMIPVGPGTLGRIMNVTGDPIDERGPIKATKYSPIHTDPPAYVEQSTSAEILVTGIKVVDLIAPYARGGKIGLFGGAGVGKTVFIQELIVCLFFFPLLTSGLGVSALTD